MICMNVHLHFRTSEPAGYGGNSASRGSESQLGRTPYDSRSQLARSTNQAFAWEEVGCFVRLKLCNSGIKPDVSEENDLIRSADGQPLLVGPLTRSYL